MTGGNLLADLSEEEAIIDLGSMLPVDLGALFKGTGVFIDG